MASRNLLAHDLIVAISVGSAAVVVFVIILFVLWKFCLRKKAQQRQQQQQTSKSENKSFDQQVDSAPSIKLPTLGNHYKVRSVLDMLNSSERKNSVEDRKYSDVEIGRNEKFHDPKEISELRRDSNIDPETEKLIYGEQQKQERLSDHSSKESVIELTEAEPNALGLILEPSAPSRLGLASKRPRLESTYLEVTPPGSRRSSHSSLQVDMHDVQSEARKSFRVKVAPIATQDSMPSLAAASSERLSTSSATHDTTSSVRIVLPKSAMRPSSEGMFDERIPKLPPKKYTRATGSTNNVRGAQSPYKKKAGCSKLIQASKSANCLFDDGDADDYDDLPPSSTTTLPLPPKLRPPLPPKQKINKSSEVLAEIDTSFKKSLTELRLKTKEDDDATDIDYEEPTPSTKVAQRTSNNVLNWKSNNVVNRTSKNVDNRTSKNAENGSERTSSNFAEHDYDETPDYDEPPEIPFKKSTKLEEVGEKSTKTDRNGENSAKTDRPDSTFSSIDRHEYEDYDEPIHHSSFV